MVKLWNFLNIKRTDAGKRLNDPNRAPVSRLDDRRINFLETMATAFAGMRGGKGIGRVMSLTSETRSALVQTLHGLIHTIRLLLNGRHSYVLPGNG